MTQAANSQSVKRLKVSEVMVKDPVVINSDMSIMDAANAMAKSDCGCLLVMTDDKIVGIVTERDIVRKGLHKYSEASDAKVSSIMSAPLVVVRPDATVEEAAEVMVKHSIRRLPVVDSRGVVGLITVSDLAKAFAKQLQYSDAIMNAIARMPSPPKAIYG